MITRCVCFGKTFKEIKKIADAHNATTVEELQKHVIFGKNCQRCHPYVTLMLETGETIFEPLAQKPEPGSTD